MKGEQRRYPVIDSILCSRCLGCLEVAPKVFCYNEGFDMVEVLELVSYEGCDVDEAIALCPRDCIFWDQG